MRCTNCGWDSPNNVTRCEKCGGVLAGGQPVNNVQGGAQAANQFAKTVNEGQFFRDVVDGGQRPSPTARESSPEPEQKPRQEQQQQQFAHAAEEPRQKATGNFTGTINPWAQSPKKHKCTLTPIAQPDDEVTLAAIAFSGDKHSLNRENLDAENQTITSKEQAELTCVDGQWYICDKSSLQTTFVHAADPVALKDGDIILMGNRQFVFKAGK